MKKMGSVKDLMGKIPGLSQMSGDLDNIDADGEVKRIQGIIDSMTAAERTNPHMIDISRRRRISAGAGVDPADVSSLVKQFDAMAALVKQMSQMSMIDKVRMMSGLGRGGGIQPRRQALCPEAGNGQAALAQGKREGPEAAREGRAPEAREQRNQGSDEGGASPPRPR